MIWVVITSVLFFLFRRRTLSGPCAVLPAALLTFSRWRDFAQLWNTFIHCFVERDVFLFTVTDFSSCISSLDTIGNLETSTSSVGPGVVVVFTSFVSVFLDSGSRGASSADGKEISPKTLSQTILKVGNDAWTRWFQPGGAGHHHLDTVNK